MSIEIAAFEAGLGAEVGGVDIRAPLSRRIAVRSAPPGSSIWYCAFASSR